MIWLRARSEWQRRWVALGALTVLVALVGTVVLTAAAGSRRTRSSVDRADRITRNGSYYAELNDGTTLAEAERIAQLPEVAVAKRIALMGLFSQKGYAVAAAPVDPGFGTDLLKSRVLRGRAANPAAPDEIALPETTARAFGLDVGGTLELASPSPRQWTCLGPTSPNTKFCIDTAAILDRDVIDLTALEGPHVQLRVVGITRTLFDVGAASNVVFFNILTPAFFARYRTTVKWNPTVMLRYRPGVSDTQFEAALSKVVPSSDITDSNTFTSVIAPLRSTAGVLANGLVVFAIVAALVGLVLISQVLSRNAERMVEDREALRVFGATRFERVLDTSVPLLPVAAVGSVLAVLGAWIASEWMPIGLARRAEFAPGREFDASVLIGGALILATVVMVSSAGAAFWAARARRSVTPKRPVRGLPIFGSVTTRTAANMVTEVGHGRRAIPLRSAVVGTALAMAGVIGVAVFSGSLTRLTTEPARQGWGWDAVVRGFTQGDAEVPNPDTVANQVVADSDVRAVTELFFDYEPRVKGHTVPGYAEQFVKGENGFVIVSGRAPQSIDEVALGVKTLRYANAAIGRSVDVEGKSLRVVGTAVFPATSNSYALADGALFTYDGARALKLVATGGTDLQLGVTLRSGVDRAAAMQRLRAFNNGDAPTGPVPHSEIQQLQGLDRLPWVLAAFLVAIALLAVGHLIVLSVRRRARDLAVLRALGCTPRQIQRIVAWQATMLAIVGTLIGAPLGILLGRAVWTRIAEAYGVRTDTAWPWVVIVSALVGTLVLANAIAWWPAHRAARRPVVDALRAE